MIKKADKKIEFGSKASYRIVVQGKLDNEWSSYFEDLKVELKKDKNGEFQSIISGSVKDQSELSGILNSIYNRHLSVLKVAFLKSNKDSSQ